MKDRPLMLRRRSNGSLYLTDPQGWPPRHEFSMTWLMESGVASLHCDEERDEIHITLANASAVYQIERDLMQDSEGNKLSTGYWGTLKESTFDG